MLWSCIKLPVEEDWNLWILHIHTGVYIYCVHFLLCGDEFGAEVVSFLLNPSIFLPLQGETLKENPVN